MRKRNTRNGAVFLSNATISPTLKSFMTHLYHLYFMYWRFQRHIAPLIIISKERRSRYSPFVLGQSQLQPGLLTRGCLLSEDWQRGGSSRQRKPKTSTARGNKMAVTKPASPMPRLANAPASRLYCMARAVPV